MGVVKSTDQEVLDGFCLSSTRAPFGWRSKEKRRPLVNRSVHSLFMPPIRTNGPDCKSRNEVELARFTMRYGFRLACRRPAISARAMASSVCMRRNGRCSNSEIDNAIFSPDVGLAGPPPPKQSSAGFEDVKNGFQNFSEAVADPVERTASREPTPKTRSPTMPMKKNRGRKAISAQRLAENALWVSGAFGTSEAAASACLSFGNRNCGTYDPDTRSMRNSASRPDSM